MNQLIKDGSEKTLYQGKIFEVIEQPMKVGDKKVVFEIVRRPPGIRLIIIKNNKMLITREFRNELNDFDYRLPGGKVFDTIDEYKEVEEKDILPFALEAAKRECREETGLIAKHLEYFVTTQSGATIIWDLIYFIIDDFEESGSGQELEDGEIIKVEWKTFKEIKELCKNNLIKEDRTLGVLFKFFLQNNIN